MDAYCQSKLGNVLFSLELSKRLKCEFHAVHVPWLHHQLPGCFCTFSSSATKHIQRRIRFRRRLTQDVLLSAAGVTCYAVNPGGVATNLQGRAHPNCFWGFLLCCLRPCFKQPEEGAHVSLIIRYVSNVNWSLIKDSAVFQSWLNTMALFYNQISLYDHATHVIAKNSVCGGLFQTQVMCAIDPSIADDTGYFYTWVHVTPALKSFIYSIQTQRPSHQNYPVVVMSYTYTKTLDHKVKQPSFMLSLTNLYVYFQRLQAKGRVTARTQRRECT